MDRLTERLQRARSALGRLQEVAGLATPTMLERDAAITRFNFTFELIWKTARSVLIERHGQERPLSGSPKSIIRECRIAGWLTDEQTSAMLKMADDRNLAVHVYSEETAETIYGRLADHARLLDVLLSAMEQEGTGGAAEKG